MRNSPGGKLFLSLVILWFRPSASICQKPPNTGIPISHVLSLYSFYLFILFIPQNYFSNLYDLIISIPSSKSHNGSNGVRIKSEHLWWYLRSPMLWSQTPGISLHKWYSSVSQAFPENIWNSYNSAFPQDVLPAFIAFLLTVISQVLPLL